MALDLLEAVVGFRRFSGLSGADIADKVGRTKDSIGRCETRRLHFGVSELHDYAKAAGVTVRCIVEYKGMSVEVPLWGDGIEVSRHGALPTLKSKKGRA